MYEREGIIEGANPNKGKVGNSLPSLCCFSHSSFALNMNPSSFSLIPTVALKESIGVYCGFYPLPDGGTYLLILARYAQIPAPAGVAKTQNGKTAGLDIVAYPCDEDGRVRDWEKRYEETGLSIEAAMDRLKYGLVNGLLLISNHEGALEEWEQLQTSELNIDWAQMPEQLQ